MPCPPEPGRRHIASYAVVGTRPPFLRFKLVVPDRSAEGFEIDELIRLPDDTRVAWDVGHGVGAMWDYRFRIERILSSHDESNWRRVDRELAGASTAQFEAELDDLPTASLPCEVQCWRRRVAEGFGRRPLRRLEMPDALRRFIARRRAHP